MMFYWISHSVGNMQNSLVIQYMAAFGLAQKKKKILVVQQVLNIYSVLLHFN